MSETTIHNENRQHQKQNDINISVKDVFMNFSMLGLNTDHKNKLWIRINDLWADIWVRAYPGFACQSLATVNMEEVFTACVRSLTVTVDEKPLYLLHFLSWLDYSEARVLFPEPMDHTTQRGIMEKSTSKQNQRKLSRECFNGLIKLIDKNWL